MKHLKKIIAASVLLAFSLNLTACASTSAASPQPSRPPVTTMQKHTEGEHTLRYSQPIDMSTQFNHQDTIDTVVDVGLTVGKYILIYTGAMTLLFIGLLAHH